MSTQVYPVRWFRLEYLRPGSRRLDRHQLDQAVLRRFDFKVGFNPLDPEQLRKLLAVSFPHPNWEEPEAAAQFRKLHDATPGDVAVIKRQVVMLQRSPDPVAVFGLLSAELAAKRMRGETQKRAIGFV